MKLRHILALLLALPVALTAQQPKPAPTVQVLMLSDIHFDPFHNPGIAAQLGNAAIAQWPAILATVPTPADSVEFDTIQSDCGAKAADTDITLLNSALASAQLNLSAPLFITVSGDLTAHNFPCRFYEAFQYASPNTQPPDYSAFMAKIAGFVAQQLHANYPASPIYLSLGNNDSGCNDYEETTGSPYLIADAATFAGVVLDKKNSAAITSGFPALGDYAVTLPKPFKNTTLLVMQDLFESRKYSACGSNDKSLKEGLAQQAWLQGALDTARGKHQKVWIMAHIPPGIDAYTTVRNNRKDPNACPGADPVHFLNSSLFADTLAGNTDIVSLVLLGHTHMDEMRVYPAKTGSNSIPGKLVPSITPVDGNYPSYTVATADPAHSLLKDFTVYRADNQTGIKATWTPEYTYSTTYGMSDYSGASLTSLIATFRNDPKSKDPLSQSYEQFYFVNDPAATANSKAAAMKSMWATYTCALGLDHGKDFSACACPNGTP